MQVLELDSAQKTLNYNLLNALEAERQRMLPQVRELCEEVDAALAKVIEIEADRLPAKYKGKFETIKFDSLIKKTTPKPRAITDPREDSVTFTEIDGERVIKHAPADRLAAIEFYRQQIASGKEEIVYLPNENKQYDHMLTFAKMAVNSGMLSAEDFQE